MAIMIEKQTRKFIKPLVETPPTLRRYDIGSIDQISPQSDVPIVLFYPPNSTHNQTFVFQLEKSLEKILTRLYPLAGRYVEENKIFSCNDDGVEFIQANVNITLEDFLASEMRVTLVDEFIPIKLRAVIGSTDPLLAIQVTMFEGGGVAIGATANHKIVDAGSLSVFLKEWAAINREGKDINLGTRFEASLMFPARTHADKYYPPLTKFIRKRISFSQSEIFNMKAKASVKDNTRRWSKVQLVSAIMWKTFIGVDLAKHNNPRESILLTPISLRERMASVIPKHTCGNLLGCIEIRSSMFETTEKIVDLVSDSIKKTVSSYSKVHHDTEEGQLMVFNSWLNMEKLPHSAHLVMISSWCKHPFYEADFGFGKPIWATPATIPFSNLVILLDDAGGDGVEAYVFLEVKDLHHFEKALAEQRFNVENLL